MRTPLFNNNEFLSQDQLNAAAGLVSDSLEDITYALHTPGLVGASNLSFSYSGLNVTVNAPLPFMALFSDGTLASANGTVDGESSSSATVDFSSLVPSTGSVTAYLVATSGSVAQSPTSIIGPPVGHPDFSPSFQPYTAYSEQQDTLIFSATLTAPDNETTLFIASTVLSAGQTVITSSSTTGQVRAGAILSRNGEVLAADLGSGAAASNVGTLGGSLVGTLPNPTLASTGATSGTYINPVTITVDEDGRISDIANVSNWNVPGNVTAGGTIVASGTISGAAATAASNMVPYSQAFQYLAPAATESITLGNTLHTAVQPSSGITADIAITLEPGSVVGQEVTGYGSASASGSVTYQSNVTTGSPYIELPDGSQVYSWVVPAGASEQGIHADWDGTNWRAKTFGQEVVAPATQNNAAVQLAQLLTTLGRKGSVAYSASTTLTSANAGQIVFYTGSASGTFTLPASNAAGSYLIPIVISNQGGAPLTVAPPTGNGLDATVTVLQQGQMMAVSNDGDTDWHTLWSTAGSTSPTVTGDATANNQAVNLGQFPASLGNPGYQKLASGLIIQWGRYVAADADTIYDVTLPITFPNEGLVLVVTPYDNNATTISSAQGYFVSNSTIGMNVTNANITLSYIAIGY